jgi:hypothetical protein
VSRLTRSIQDRIFIGLLGLVFAPVCGYFLFFVPIRPWHGETDWVFRALALLRIEGLSVVFSIASLGLVWAVWTPDWIERRLRKAVHRLLLLVFVVSVCVTAICFYMLVVGTP